MNTSKFIRMSNAIIDKVKPIEQEYDYRKILEQNSKEYKETRKRAY